MNIMMLITKNRLVSERVSSGVETRRILGSVVKTQGQTGADEDCNIKFNIAKIKLN